MNPSQNTCCKRPHVFFGGKKAREFFLHTKKNVSLAAFRSQLFSESNFPMNIILQACKEESHVEASPI